MTGYRPKAKVVHGEVAMKHLSFQPKLFSLLRSGISKKQIFDDINAGLIVGIVALPLAIAFAIASGVSPDKGIITAIVAGFLISFLGGSRVQIGGPTGAFIVIIYAIVIEHGVTGLIVSTFMAGLILILLGAARLGGLLRYIPYPLIVGFTSGIAVIIFSSQINDFLGLGIEKVPADFIDKWKLYALHVDNINWYAAAIAAASILITVGFRRISRKIPGSVIAIIFLTSLVHLLELPVLTIESMFGDIPHTFPMPSLPQFNFKTIQSLIQPAFAIAFLGAIESLLSAVISDGMIGGKHRSNTELIAQGIANCTSALFGGIPATGAIARTATNINNGGRTPVAGIVHSIVLLLIMLIFAPLAKLIPMACLAGILVVVAFHMSEWRQFLSLLKGNRYDVIVLLTTFFLTVVFDLVIAIQVGIILSSFILMKRMSDSLMIKKSVDLFNHDFNNQEIFEEESIVIPKDVMLYEISGPLFFGAAQAFQDTFHEISDPPKIFIIRLREVPFIDATGIYRLKEIIVEFQKNNIEVVLSGARHSVQADLIKNNIYSVLSKENIAKDIYKAIERANSILNQKQNQTDNKTDSGID